VFCEELPAAAPGAFYLAAARRHLSLSEAMMTDLTPDVTRHGTGIDGLDALLRGGFPAGALYLVDGDPGTGKTTLALQFLLEGARCGEPGLYITLSESARELAQVAASHGWSLDPVSVFDLSAVREAAPETEYTFFHPSEVELAETTKAVIEHVERTVPARVVIDSLSEMRLMARDSLRYRRQVLALKQFFAARDCTVLLLDDRTADASDRQLESIAHGVVRLEALSPEYGGDRRRLQVRKVRGIEYTTGHHDFVIQPGGLVVFPRLVAGDHRVPFDAAALPSGIAELDTLLGGGITFGSATLLTGPAGSGKSTLALAYATAEAVRGGHAAVFTFEEGRESMIARADALGQGASEHIEAGRLLLREINAAELTPGQFAHAVRDAVERGGARVVVIDSLNGYLASMANERALQAHLHELLAYLRQRGVATLVILAQQGLVGTHMPAPVDVSYLADAILLLRFFEAGGAVRKAVSAIKMRTRTHEDTIRELRIDAAGVHVGEVLHKFRGVLTGTPEYYGVASPLSEDRGDDERD
jgi:circadian clock protein KaiC